MKNKEHNSTPKIPKSLKIIAIIGLGYTCLKLFNQMGILPKSMSNYTAMLSELFYPDDVMGIVLFSLFILYAVFVVYMIYRHKKEQTNDNVNISLWIFGTSIFIAIGIFVYFMFS